MQCIFDVYHILFNCIVLLCVSVTLYIELNFDMCVNWFTNVCFCISFKQYSTIAGICVNVADFLKTCPDVYSVTMPNLVVLR